MYKYKLNMYWSENDQLFIVEVPELPGCMADGKSQEEALKNTEIIIKEWIDTAKARGQDVPEPEIISLFK